MATMQSVEVQPAEALLPERPTLKAPAPTPNREACCDDQQTDRLLASAALTIALEEAVTADLEAGLAAAESPELTQEQRSTPEPPPGTPTAASSASAPATRLLEEVAKRASAAASFHSDRSFRGDALARNVAGSFTPAALPATPGQVVTLQPLTTAKAKPLASLEGSEHSSSESDFDSPPSREVSIAAPGCRSTGSRYYEARSTLGPVSGDLELEYPHFSKSRLKGPRIATLERSSLGPGVSISDSDSGELPVQNLSLKLEKLDQGLASTAASRPMPRLSRVEELSQSSLEDIAALPDAESLLLQRAVAPHCLKPASINSVSDNDRAGGKSCGTEASLKIDKEMQLVLSPGDSDIYMAAFDRVESSHISKAGVQQLLEANEELSLSLGASKAAERELSRRIKEVLQAQKRAEQLLENSQHQVQALLGQLSTDQELLEILDTRFRAIVQADEAGGGSNSSGLNAAWRTAKAVTARCKDLGTEKANIQQQLAVARSEVVASEQSKGAMEARAALLQYKLDDLGELNSLWQALNGAAVAEGAPASSSSVSYCRKLIKSYPTSSHEDELLEAPPAQLLVLMREYLEARSTVRQLQAENSSLQLELGTTFAKAIYSGSKMTEEQQSSIKPRAASASSIRSFPLQEAEAFDFAADTEISERPAVSHESIGQGSMESQQRKFPANDELMGRLCSMMKTYSETSTSLQERVAILSKSVGCKTLQHERAVRKYNALAAANEELTSENEHLKGVVADTKASLVKLQADFSGFEAQMEAAAQHSASTEKWASNLSAKCTALEQQLEKLQLELAEAKFAEEEASKAGQLAPLLYDAFRVNAALSETEARADQNQSLAKLYRQAYKHAKRSNSASS